MLVKKACVQPEGKRAGADSATWVNLCTSLPSLINTAESKALFGSFLLGFIKLNATEW